MRRASSGLRQPSGMPSLRPPSAAQWRDHSGNYLQALLVQDQERRNAENLSESVGISARAMQRFLTEARWSDETVIGRLQEYLAPRLGHPEAVWVFDGSDFPKQGRKSAGVARQYCGRLGKIPRETPLHPPRKQDVKPVVVVLGRVSYKLYLHFTAQHVG